VIPERFYELLFTFQTRATFLNDIPVPPHLEELARLASLQALTHRAASQPGLRAQAEQQLVLISQYRRTLLRALEAKYGDRRFDERKLLLESCLADHRLRKSIDVICAVLEKAKEQRRAVLVAWRRTDQHRNRKEQVDIVFRNLLKWLEKAQKLPRTEPPTDLDHKVNALWASVTVMFAQDPTTGLRRPKRGHQPEPWLLWAHQQLRSVGVTRKKDRQDLLMAVGITPYRPS